MFKKVWEPYLPHQYRRVKRLFFTHSDSITVQITAPLIGASPYLLFIYLLYIRTHEIKWRGGLFLKSTDTHRHSHAHTQTWMPGIAGEPGASVTSPLSDSFDCQTTDEPFQQSGRMEGGHMSESFGDCWFKCRLQQQSGHWDAGNSFIDRLSY